MAITSRTYSINSIDFITIKYDSNGRQLWTKKYTFPRLDFNDHIIDMAIDSLNNLYVSGISWADRGEPNGEMRYTTIKYDMNGIELWFRQYDHCGWNNSLASVAIDSSGSVYLTGSSFCGGLETVKYDTAGNLLWGRLITNDVPKSLSAKKIKVDSIGNIYIVALESGNDFGGCKVIKLDSSGNELWRTTQDFSYYWWSFDLDADIDTNGNALAAVNIKDYNINAFAYAGWGRYEDAISQYHLALKFNPSNSEAHNNLGIVYINRGKLEDALSEFQAAIKLTSNNPQYYVNAGSAYFEMGLSDKSIEQLLTALKLAPNFIDAHYNLGMVYNSVELKENARNELETALKIKPGFLPAVQALEEFDAKLP